MDWSGTINFAVLGRFVSLRGVNLKLSIYRAINDSLGEEDTARIARRTFQKLRSMVSAFRQYQLKNSLTTVTLIEFCGILSADLEEPGKVGNLERKIKGRMLEYSPRRLSRRGKRDEW